jgi:small subunit ribosomal protein S3
MGQKVNPIIFRMGIVQQERSVWYAKSKGDFSKYLHQDMQVRAYVEKTLAAASVSRIQIERTANVAKIIIHSARPGVIIGRKGSGIADMTKVIAKQMGVDVHINIAEIKKPDLDATLIANGVARQLERRIMFRRAMKRSVQSAMRAGALGVKMMVGGRLGGAEIARSEWYREGRVPLHTLSADIDYGVARASTTYGVIGIKVWIFKGIKKQEKGSHS